MGVMEGMWLEGTMFGGMRGKRKGRMGGRELHWHLIISTLIIQYTVDRIQTNFNFYFLIPHSKLQTQLHHQYYIQSLYPTNT